MQHKIEIEALRAEEKKGRKECTDSSCSAEFERSKSPKREHVHHHGNGHSHGHSHGHTHSHENHWLKAVLGLIWGIGLLVLSVGGWSIPVMAYYALTGLTTLMTLYLGSTVYQSAWIGLLEQRWDTTTLYSISTLTILTVSFLGMFVPGLPLMMEAAPLVLAFWHLGEGIEHTLLGEIHKKLDVRDCVPPKVLLKGDVEQHISVKKLMPNDTIIVKQGSVIPVDGVVMETTLLYTTRIDGSPSLKTFKAGDSVKAGMCVANHVSPLEMRVSKTYQNSYLSLIADNIKKANDEKAPVEIFANKILKYFIPGLLTVALISGLVIASLGNPALAIQCVVSVLVSACPCALSVITPLAVKIGMQKASEKGIHFNNGKALQAAADIDTVVFDLNGTLTQGNITIKKFSIADKAFLGHVALLESKSDHPVAQVIQSYAEEHKTMANETLTMASFDTHHHSGVQGLINGVRFMIGNKEMLAANGVVLIDKPYDNPDNGSVYIVRERQVIGQIALADPLRADAVATVLQLKRLGKTVHLCTGADLSTAKAYAKEMGISKNNICANAVGVAAHSGETSKTSYIEQLQRKGHTVAMVGDAANDVSAIALADTGIAVKSCIGDEITQQHAGIVVQQGLLFPIAMAFDIAHKTQRNIFQNLIVSLGYNSIITIIASGLLVALGLTLNPVVGVALMVVESTIVLANLYRLKHQDSLPEIVNSDVKSNGAASENSTASVLNALNSRIQSNKTFDTPEDASIHSLAGKLFASKEQPTGHSVEGSYESPVY